MLKRCVLRCCLKVETVEISRSTTPGNYMIPRTHRHLANRAFAVAAPSSWNSLPDNVRDSLGYTVIAIFIQT